MYRDPLDLVDCGRFSVVDLMSIESPNHSQWDVSELWPRTKWFGREQKRQAAAGLLRVGKHSEVAITSSLSQGGMRVAR